MALKKEINHKGLVLSYWRIIKMTSEADKGTTLLRLDGYVDEEARRKSPQNSLDRRAISVDGVDHTRETAYTALKEQEEVHIKESQDEEGNPVNEKVMIPGPFNPSEDA